jgi:uncharacterized protein YegP (UPF0339 family)
MAAQCELETGSNGQFHFNLKAGGGEIIGQSRMYAAEKSRDKGIEPVKKNGANAEVRDNTYRPPGVPPVATRPPARKGSRVLRWRKVLC